MSAPVPPAFPPTGQQPLSPGKKSNILIWIIGGIVLLMCGVTLMCGLGGYLLMRKAKNAGFDSALLSTNPAYAAAKMAITMSPDVETVNSDDSSGTITVRDRKTGKTSTFKFDPDKKSMVVTGEDGKEVTMSVTGSGEKGALEVQSAEGTMKFGSGGQMPAWMPVYPGSSPQGSYSAESKDGGQHGFSFTTKDAPAKVVAFYQEQLKSAGFTVNMATTGDQGGMVMAEDAGKKKSAVVTVGASSEGTTANLMLTEKN